jgi:antitoxin (DNA-binding transcriptional repressor) of toxin-antitoxin stability system
MFLSLSPTTNIQLQPEISISQFKATCLAVLEEVRRSGQSVLVTRFGVPVAEIHPPSPPKKPANWVGRMAGTGKITGDLVVPATDSADWDAI